MYSRNLSGRNSGDEKYRANVPPKYSGSRFSTNQNSQNLPDEVPLRGDVSLRGDSRNALNDTGRRPASDERRTTLSREPKPNIPVKVAPETGLRDTPYTGEVIDEDEIISLPDFEFSSDMFTSRRASAFSPEETEVFESTSYEPILEDELDDSEIRDTDTSEVSGHVHSEHKDHEEHEKEKKEEPAKGASKGGFLANIFGGGGEKGRFSYEDLLLGGLILLISSSGTKDNEDILIILALLLAYRD